MFINILVIFDFVLLINNLSKPNVLSIIWIRIDFIIIKLSVKIIIP